MLVKSIYFMFKTMDGLQEKMVSLNKVEKYLRENIILYIWATNLDQREEWFNTFRKSMEE